MRRLHSRPISPSSTPNPRPDLAVYFCWAPLHYYNTTEKKGISTKVNYSVSCLRLVPSSSISSPGSSLRGSSMFILLVLVSEDVTAVLLAVELFPSAMYFPAYLIVIRLIIFVETEIATERIFDKTLSAGNGKKVHAPDNIERNMSCGPRLPIPKDDPSRKMHHNHILIKFPMDVLILPADNSKEIHGDLIEDKSDSVEDGVGARPERSIDDGSTLHPHSTNIDNKHEPISVHESLSDKTLLIDVLDCNGDPCTGPRGDDTEITNKHEIVKPEGTLEEDDDIITTTHLGIALGRSNIHTIHSPDLVGKSH